MEAARFGQPLTEVQRWSPVLRKAFIYTAAIKNGCKVNWETGDVIAPKR